MTHIKRLKQLRTKLTSLADAVRDRTGSTEQMTLEELKAEIDYMPGGSDDETFILIDEDGNEIPAVLTNEEVDLTATANDIRSGSVAVTDDGVIEGTKDIPPYHTYEGFRVVPKNTQITLPHEHYDYTKLQAIICLYNNNSSDSVAAIKVAINDNVYSVGSSTSLSAITKDHEIGRIIFGIKNDSGGLCVLRYIMYKEIY